MIHFIQYLFQTFLNWNGATNTSGTTYGFWSGFGSDLGEVAILGAILTGLRHLNCHVKGCPRIGHHSVEGTPYKTCRKHHPDLGAKNVPLETIHDAHRQAKNRATIKPVPKVTK